MLNGEWNCRRSADAGHFRRSYLDSLDWRLLRNGLYLVADHFDDHIQLRLIDLSTRQLRVKTACDQVPVFAPWPPAKELSAALAPILGRRALVTHITVAVTRHALTVHDAHGQSVAHLDLELSAPTESVDAASLLDRRLCFTPIEGHDGTNSAIVNILCQHGVPVTASVTPVTELITALNIDTSRFDTRPNMAFDDEARSDTAVKHLLAFFLSLMETNHPTVIADTDSVCLHDFRVATRRCRSLLKQARGVITQRQIKRARMFFARLSSVTSRQRDLDVMLVNFALYRSLLPAQMQEQLDAVYAHVAAQRRTAYAATVQFLRSAEYRRFVNSWRAYLAATPPRRTVLASAALPVKVMADTRIWKAYKRALAEGGTIENDSPPEAHHGLRKRCKTLRYLIECYAPLYPPAKIQRVLGILKRLQDNLGDYQDLQVHGELLVGTRASLTERGQLTPGLDTVIARLTQSLAARGDENRARFRKSYTAFTTQATQRLFRRLFKP